MVASLATAADILEHTVSALQMPDGLPIIAQRCTDSRWRGIRRRLPLPGLYREAWEDSGRMLTYELGRSLHPKFVPKRFRALAAEVGLPVIKFHAARHIATTPALEAGVDIPTR